MFRDMLESYTHNLIVSMYFQAQDIVEELDLEGRPSRFNRVQIYREDKNDSAENPKPKHQDDMNRSKKWRKTGIKSLSSDFRDTF